MMADACRRKRGNVFWRVLFRRFGFVAVLSLLCVGVSAVELDDDEAPWVEGAFEMPAYPKQGSLISFPVGIRTDITFSIDGETISVGEDGVIRYVLVVVSALGARNVSFEGMRCGTGERRLYATGRSDGTWSAARSDQWTKIRGSRSNHHVELFLNYFCTIGAPAIVTPEAARRVLLKGGAGESAK
ncbi:CNP1-like family protein [uncultured Propionivibrio sp.]|uniref:CNP1-like family protein n=1 Tax=uncultured Propionivibrio sp. TaxID=426737 RepID=UPI0029C04218|nr:CNP1-like family protein [uncultured Propionivibrio sp.]